MHHLDPPPPASGASSLALALGLIPAVLTGFFALGAPVQLLNPAAGLWFTELVVFLGVPVVALRVLGRPFARVTGLDSAGGASLGLGVALGLANYAGWAVPLMGLVQALFPAELVERYDAAPLFANQTGPERLFFVLGVALVAPVCEEFFFRGVVQRALLTRLRPPVAIAATAVLFSAFHADPVGFLPRLELGLLFGVLAFRSGSLWPGVAAHAANNATATVLFLLSGDQPQGELSTAFLLALAAGGNLALILLAWVARGRLLAPRPADDLARAPPAGVGAAALPFLVVGSLLLGGVWGLDRKGAELRLHEATHPVPRALSRDPELATLRAKARAGEISLDTYVQARALRRASASSERPAGGDPRP